MAKKKPVYKMIREVVIRNHGGFAEATNSQIMELWKSLPTDVQRRYMVEFSGGREPVLPTGRQVARGKEDRNEVADANSD